MPPKRAPKPRGGQNKTPDRAITIIIDGHLAQKKPAQIDATLQAEGFNIHRNTIAKYRGRQRRAETTRLRNEAIVEEATEAPLDGSHNHTSRLPTAEYCRAAVAAKHDSPAVRQSAGKIGPRAAQKSLAPHRRIVRSTRKSNVVAERLRKLGR